MAVGLKDFFSNRVETADNHPNPDLQTRYYKTTQDKAMRVLEDMIRSDPRIRIVAISAERGEISVEYMKPKKAFMVINVVTVFPYKTAIDFTITTKTLILPMDGGFSKKEAIGFYEKLDKQLQFTGTGLTEETPHL